MLMPVDLVFKRGSAAWVVGIPSPPKKWGLDVALRLDVWEQSLFLVQHHSSGDSLFGDYLKKLKLHT